MKALLTNYTELGEHTTKPTGTVDIANILVTTGGKYGEEGQKESWEDNDEETGLCDSCIKTKIQRNIIRTPVTRTKPPFELVQLDLCGPITPPSMGGARYFILYIDDFSPITHVYCLRNKSAEEVVSIFKEFTNHIKT